MQVCMSEHGWSSPFFFFFCTGNCTSCTPAPQSGHLIVIHQAIRWLLLSLLIFFSNWRVISASVFFQNFSSDDEAGGGGDEATDLQTVSDRPGDRTNRNPKRGWYYFWPT